MLKTRTRKAKTRRIRPGFRKGGIMTFWRADPLSLENIHSAVAKSLHQAEWKGEPGKAQNLEAVNFMTLDLVGLLAKKAKAKTIQLLKIKEIMAIEANKRISIVDRNNKLLALVGKRKELVSIFLKMEEIASSEAHSKTISTDYRKSHLKRLSRPVTVKDKAGHKYVLGHRYCSTLVHHAFIQVSTLLHNTNQTIQHGKRMQILGDVARS